MIQRRKGVRPAVLALLLSLCGVASASADSALLLRCRQALTREAERYADKRRHYIQRCAERLLDCELALERNGSNPTDCRAQAQLSCLRLTSADPLVGGIGKAIAAYESHLVRDCETVDYASIAGTGPGQLWHGNDLDCGTSADLSSLVACVRARLEESVDTSFGDTFPRAGLLLDAAGFGGDLPNVPRPSVSEVSVAATAAASGTLAAPGTIAVAAGSALRLIGDASTLPCGEGTNGDLTVKILTLGAACTDAGAVREELQLHEPYGAERAGLAGPFTADATYCLELSDGSCADTVSGTIDVP